MSYDTGFFILIISITLIRINVYVFTMEKYIKQIRLSVFILMIAPYCFFLMYIFSGNLFIFQVSLITLLPFSLIAFTIQMTLYWKSSIEKIPADTLKLIFSALGIFFGMGAWWLLWFLTNI